MRKSQDPNGALHEGIENQHLADVYKEGAHFLGRFMDGLDLLLGQKLRVLFDDVKMISF